MGDNILSVDAMTCWEKWGFVRVSQALSLEYAHQVQEAFWRELEARHGIVLADPSTWRPGFHNVNKDIVDAATGTQVTDRLRGAIDQILGQEQWRPLRTFGGILMTMPDPRRTVWDVVHEGWHFDNDPIAYLQSCDDLMLFTFFSSVQPQGGGTAVLAGSHHLVKKWLQGQTRDTYRIQNLDRFAHWHPYLAELQGIQPSRLTTAEWLELVAEVHGIEVFVTELTGEPGDAILCHPALFHAVSHNVSDRPRLMRRTNARRWRDSV